MPSLSIQNSQIEESLRSSLTRGKPEQSLAEILVSQSRAILLKKIAFVAAETQSCGYHSKVKAKYVSSKMNETAERKQTGMVMNGEHKRSLDGEGLPQPKLVLYPPDGLTLTWRQPVRMGTGLSNLGNTCFCNATLQCLLYTPPLFYYLVQKTHLANCRLHHFCMLCVMEEVVRNVINKSGGVYQPLPVVRSFKAISKHFTLGRQEDAHEFLRYVIDSMTKSLLWGKPKMDSFSKNTTAVHQIFSGYLRSQVRCKNCDFRSNTYDPFFDIALDIKEASNVYKALEHFTKGEFLSGENSYLCEKCKRRVNAVKRFSLHKVPQIFTLSLKRFDAVRLTKINREIHFPPTFNIRPFMSVKQGEPIQYNLYGVLVHQGFSTSSGHYYSFVKSPSGQWLKMDDNRVQKVSLEVVLRQSAYILFYNRADQGKKTVSQGPTIGPQLPQNNQQNKVANGPLSNPGTHPGTPIVRKPLAPNSTLSKVVHLNAATPAKNIKPPTQSPSPAVTKVTGSLQKPGESGVTKATIISPPSKLSGLDQRNKVSFGISLMKPRVVENKERTTENGKIVMKIKHGKVVSNTASPDKLTNGGKKSPSTGTSPPVNGNQRTKAEGLITHGGMKHRLVPYLDGESSDSEEEGTKGKGVNGFPSGNNGVGKHDHNKSQSPSPGHVTTGKEGKKRRHSESFEPVLDEKLKATTEVPGAYAPLDREKCNGFKNLPASSQKGLSVKVNPPEGKVNATSKWTVFEQDQKSPSIASSNSSVGSAVGWNVSTTEEKQGTVETQREKVNGKQTSTSSHEVSPKREKKTDFKCEKPRVNGDSAGAKHAGKSDHSKKTTSLFNSHGGNGLKERDSFKADNDSGVKNSKKPTHFEGNGETQPAIKKSRLETGPGSSSTDAGIPGKNLPGSRERESLIEKKHVNCSDTQPLIDGDSSGSSAKKHKKHKKKKKKHKADVDVYEYSSEAEGSGKRRKHKKKRRKPHAEDEQRLLSEEEGEVGEKSGATEQAGDYNSSTSEEFQWVERTKETIEKEQSTPRHRHNTAVPVKQWDAGVKDLKKSEQNGEKPKVPAENRKSWDGSRNQGDVLKELYKESLQGYGAAVSSWEGGKSTIDQEVIHEHRKDRKRVWEEEYEEELDRGKTRKVKRAPDDRPISKVNYFQKYQENNNKEAKARNLFDTFSTGNDKAGATKPHHQAQHTGTNGWGGKPPHRNGKDWRSQPPHHSGGHRIQTNRH